MKVRFLAAIAGLAVAGSAQAATIFFSETSSGPQTPGNLAVTMDAGTSKTIFMWAALNPDLDGEGTPEKLIGLAVDLQATQAGVATASGWATALPTRWQVNTAPTYSNQLFSGLALGAITTAGLDGSLTSQGAAGSGHLRVGSFTINAGAAAGTTNAFLKVGTQTIAYAAGQGGPNINFGTGDLGVPGAQIGATSTLPDLSITVGGEIPEPASLSLAALAGLGLVRRRRA